MLFIRAPFYVLLVFVAVCSVFCLFWLSCQVYTCQVIGYRKTPLRKPNCGEGIVSKKPRPKNTIIFLFYSIVSLFNCMVVLFPCPTWYTLYFCGTIQPVSAESAAKQQTKPNLNQLSHHFTAKLKASTYLQWNVPIPSDNKLCARPHNMPRSCTPHVAAQLQPIHALRLRRPARLASSSCGLHEYSWCTRQTDVRHASLYNAHPWAGA